MPKNDYLVIGMGGFGIEVADQLLLLGKSVAVMDSSSAIIDRIGKKYDYAVVADATDVNALKDFGVRDMTTVIVAIGEIDPSIMACTVLKELGVTNIFVKAKNSLHKKILSLMGVSNVFIPEMEFAKKIAVQSAFKSGIDISSTDSDHSIVKIQVTKKEVTSIPLKNLELKKNNNLIIIAILKNGKMFMPFGDSELEMGNEVLFLTNNSTLNKAIKAFQK
jgi:trk system potassium uptake protein TrkA